MNVRFASTIGQLLLSGAVIIATAVPGFSGNVQGTYTEMTEGDEVDLSCKGDVDWVKWAAGNENGTSTWSTARKNGVTEIISADLTAKGSAPPGVTIELFAFSHVTNPLLKFTWTDGDNPTEGESVSSVTQALVPAQTEYPIGIGQQMTAAASATSRTLDVYVVGYNSDMKITATLSGGASTSTVVSPTQRPVDDPSNYYAIGCYQVVYDGAGETLTVCVETQDPRAPGSHAQFANAGMFAAAITTGQPCETSPCPLTAAANAIEATLPWPLADSPNSNEFPRVAAVDMLQSCRTFRDEVLGQTQDGKRLVALYYDHGSEISAILHDHPKLAFESVGLVLTALPALQSSLDGGFVVGASTFDDGLQLMDRVGQLGSPELATALDEVRSILSRRMNARGENVAITLGPEIAVDERVNPTHSGFTWRPIQLCGVALFGLIGVAVLRRARLRPRVSAR